MAAAGQPKFRQPPLSTAARVSTIRQVEGEQFGPDWILRHRVRSFRLCGTEVEGIGIPLL
jgi:hypothetical protein